MVLVHYGAPDLTLRCLRSLAALEPEPHRVIVVDHGPLPGLEEALRGAHPCLTVVPEPANRGYGAGCNLGAALAFQEGAELVWFLNNDAILDRATLATLAELAREHPGIALWGTGQQDGDRLLGADWQPAWCEGPVAAPSRPLPHPCRQLQGRETLSGASILIAREHWEALGPWPEDYFLYLEDTAWCLRAHRLGLPLALSGLAVIHRRSSTIGRHSRLATFYGVRNQLRLHRTLHPHRQAGRLALALHLLQKRLVQGRWSLLPHVVRGILAAFRGQAGRDPRY